MIKVKRIVAILTLGILVSGLGSNYDGKAQIITKNEKNNNYIISIRNKDKFDNIKNELSKKNKLVVTHNKSDEKYIYDEQIMIGSLTHNDVNSLKKDGVNMEIDEKVTANMIPQMASEGAQSEIVEKQYPLPDGAIAAKEENREKEYSDNPYFYRDRFTTAICFSKEYINTMRKDTGSTMGFKYYYADERVPLFQDKMYSF